MPSPTSFQSVNRFAVLNDVEPGSSSSKKDSRPTILNTTATTTMATTSMRRNHKVAVEYIDGNEKKKAIKSNKMPPSSSTTTSSKPIVVDSTTTKSSLKSRQPNSNQVRNNPKPNPNTLNDQPPSPAAKLPLATPVKKTNWEIPRKTLHGSIGFLVLYLHSLHPPSLTPLLYTLLTLLLPILLLDILRTHLPPLNTLYIQIFGPLMRSSEVEGEAWNGVVWYLIGCLWSLGVYPRDVAVVSVLTLSWSDTAASTIGRLLSPHSPLLPIRIPLIPFLPFSPKKSLAGFLAAFLTGTIIGAVFWSGGKHSDGGYGQLWLGPGAGTGTEAGGRDLSVWAGERASEWAFLRESWGRWATALVVGLTGAVVEALDLGYDDNLTLPILTGAIVWAWLTIVSLLTT